MSLGKESCSMQKVIILQGRVGKNFLKFLNDKTRPWSRALLENMQVKCVLPSQLFLTQRCVWSGEVCTLHSDASVCFHGCSNKLQSSPQPGSRVLSVLLCAVIWAQAQTLTSLGKRPWIQLFSEHVCKLRQIGALSTFPYLNFLFFHFCLQP